MSDRRERRRRQILAAAKEIFSDKGYSATTVDDIVSRIEIPLPAVGALRAPTSALGEGLRKDHTPDLRESFVRRIVQSVRHAPLQRYSPMPTLGTSKAAL